MDAADDGVAIPRGTCLRVGGGREADVVALRRNCTGAEDHRDDGDENCNAAFHKGPPIETCAESLFHALHRLLNVPFGRRTYTGSRKRFSYILGVPAASVDGASGTDIHFRGIV